MPVKPLHPCNAPGCPALTATRFCPTHTRADDTRRGTSARRGYSGPWLKCRAAVLRRDPVCTICHRAPSTDADHYPRTRRELVALGLDPNDPMFARGTCHSCHASKTARQDGGFTGVVSK